MNLFVPFLRANGVKLLGIPRYIGPHVKIDDYYLITLGERVTISDHCTLLTHDYSITTALIASGKEVKKDAALIRGIEIGNNVFIGTRSIVMPGTVIPDNVIIGAGSVVRGKLESNYVYIGNPLVKMQSMEKQVSKWEKYINSDSYRED